MRDWSPHMAGAPRLLALACVALAPLLAPPARAQAQLVTGTVQESGSGAAVAGALVRLLDAEGDVVRSFLTAADGRYRLRGARNGPHTLVVERIGYASTRIGPVHLSGGGATLRNIVVTQNPIELEGLTVEGAGRRCDLRDEGTGATQVVWAQVRTALEASTWTGREGNLGFRIRAWERRLSPGDLTILDEGHRTYRTRAGNSVRSLPARELAQGGYVLADCDGTPDVILMGSGSELQLCVAAARRLSDEGKKARVVSMPCMELFAAQSEAYRDEVLPPAVTNRVAVEAGVRMCWDRWIGPSGKFVGMEGFGASGPFDKVYEHFGINVDAVVAAAQ